MGVPSLKRQGRRAHPRIRTSCGSDSGVGKCFTRRRVIPVQGQSRLRVQRRHLVTDVAAVSGTATYRGRHDRAVCDATQPLGEEWPGHWGRSMRTRCSSANFDSSPNTVSGTIENFSEQPGWDVILKPGEVTGGAVAGRRVYLECLATINGTIHDAGTCGTTQRTSTRTCFPTDQRTGVVPYGVARTFTADGYGAVGAAVAAKMTRSAPSERTQGKTRNRMNPDAVDSTGRKKRKPDGTASRPAFILERQDLFEFPPEAPRRQSRRHHRAPHPPRGRSVPCRATCPPTASTSPCGPCRKELVSTLGVVSFGYLSRPAVPVPGGGSRVAIHPGRLVLELLLTLVVCRLLSRE